MADLLTLHDNHLWSLACCYGRILFDQACQLDNANLDLGLKVKDGALKLPLWIAEAHVQELHYAWYLHAADAVAHELSELIPGMEGIPFPIRIELNELETEMFEEFKLLLPHHAIAAEGA